MSARPGHDLSGIIKWSAREDWRPRVDAVMAEHFESALKAFGIAFEDIDDVLGGTWTLTLWGCAFEDFLSRRFGPPARGSGTGSASDPPAARWRRAGKAQRSTATWRTAAPC
jgi:hypothetical protein